MTQTHSTSPGSTPTGPLNALTAPSAVGDLLHDSYDVAVVGAGPGGCAAASILARGGAKVVLLERNERPSFKIGESLMPETFWTFEKMGALDRMRSAGFVEKHSVQFFAKSGKASAPFYFDSVNDHESARTWQVHRADFDQLLMDNAQEQGAEVHRGISVRSIAVEAEPRSLKLRDKQGDERVITARVVVDATGQGTFVAKQQKTEQTDYGLRHASIFTHFRGAIRDAGKDEGATIILHTNEGNSWFWYIPLANDTVSVGVVGGLEYLITGRDSKPEETFFDEVEKCPEIARRIRDADQCRPMQVIKDFSYSHPEVAGDGWVLVGDAFSFIDPVYSSGVFLALKSGEMAAEAILDGLESGDLSARQLGRFEPELRQGMKAVLGLVRSFYAPDFSFGGFLRRYPEHQEDVTKILIGDVFNQDFSSFFQHVEEYQRDGADLQAAS